MPTATTIQEVLDRLDAIIDLAIATNSRIGLFAYVYRRTTAEIASEISLGNFNDNQQLETLDVTFANLYLEAYEAYTSGQPLSASWEFAFNQTDSPLTILQHILLGMNAHINLDLAMATAKTMNNKDIATIQSDFNTVNDILFQITNELQDRLSRVSPLLILLDWIGQNTDEKIIDFSMRKAREQSWNSANLLWGIGPEHSVGAITKIDQIVLQLSQHIKSPKTRLLRWLLKLIRKLETKDVATIITRLKAS